MKREESLNYKNKGGGGSKLPLEQEVVEIREINKRDPGLVEVRTKKEGARESKEKQDRIEPRRSGCWNRGGATRVYKNNSSWLWLARGLTVGLT